MTGLCICCQRWRDIDTEDGHCGECGRGDCDHDEDGEDSEDSDTPINSSRGPLPAGYDEDGWYDEDGDDG